MTFRKQYKSRSFVMSLTYAQALNFGLMVAKKRLYTGRNDFEIVWLVNAELNEYVTAIKKQKARPDRTDAVNEIVKEVCDWLKVPVDRFYTKSRKRTLVKARQIACLLSYQVTTSVETALIMKVPRISVEARKNAAVNYYETEADYRAIVDGISSKLNIKIEKTHEKKIRRSGADVFVLHNEREVSASGF